MNDDDPPQSRGENPPAPAEEDGKDKRIFHSLANELRTGRGRGKANNISKRGSSLGCCWCGDPPLLPPSGCVRRIECCNLGLLAGFNSLIFGPFPIPWRWMDGFIFQNQKKG
jgi:hypothetical protein